MTNANAPESAFLIGDCWSQVFQLHRSLADLKRMNAQGWELLERGHGVPRSVPVLTSARIDPDTWRKRAEEARVLAEITPDIASKRSLFEIAESYDALAWSDERKAELDETA